MTSPSSGVLERVGGANGVVARVGGTAGVAIVVVAVAVAVGAASAGDTQIALMLGIAVLALGVAIANPVLVVALAAVATLLMQRVGGALSISDVVLAGASAVAVFLLRGSGIRTMSTLLWAGIGYLAAIIPTLVLNPYAANVVEWVHDLVLVLGSLVVGFVVGRRGRAQVAVGLYVLGCCVIAVIATATAVQMLLTQHRFGPVYLPDLHKNLIGCLVVGAMIIVYGRPAWFRLAPRWRWTVFLICGAGLAASGSRQAVVGLAIGLLVIALRRHPETGKRPRLPWILLVLVPYGIIATVLDQLSSGDKYNSAFQRLTWFSDSMDIWSTSPLFGVGLRWWYTDRFGVNFQPPNLEFEQLTTVGIVGLVAVMVLFVVGFATLWRMDPWYGTVGAAIVAARFTEAQFDLYWVAGQASFLWIVAGICFGALERKRREDAAPVASSVARPDRSIALAMPRG